MHITIIDVMSNGALPLFSLTNLKILGILNYSVLHLKNKNKIVDPVTEFYLKSGSLFSSSVL